MGRFLAIGLLVLTLCAQTAAQAQEESNLIPLISRQDSARWDAVGRLDISGKGFCTAALIRDNLILTAAHCLFDTDGTRISPDRFVFRAGFRGGRAEALRDIRRTIPHPDYDFSDGTTNPKAVAVDIGLLELARPIRSTRIRPYEETAFPITGDSVRVISYGRGREDAPSLQDVCAVLGRQTGVVVMTCEVAYGSSGSPVFMEVRGQQRIVSVVSAMAQVDGEQVSLGTSLKLPLIRLLTFYSALGPAGPDGVRRLTPGGTQNDTGAKFVSP